MFIVNDIQTVNHRGVCQFFLRQVAEGVPTILAGVKLAAKLGLELPLLAAIHAAVYERVPMADILAAMMARPVTQEEQ